MLFTKESPRLLFKNGNYYYPIQEEDILYLTADGAYTLIYLKDRKISVSKHLKDVVEKLNKSLFCRIHNSMVVNLNHIVRFSKYDENVVEMIDGKQLPLSKSRKKEFLEFFTSV